MKTLFFFPNEWDIDYDSHATIARMKTMPNYQKQKMVGWQLGNWDFDWSTITADFCLEEGEDYTFYFWLNGGENDHHDEVCELEIFGEDWNQRQTFTLSRNYTKPVIYKGGWFLFAIPFTATDATMTLRFNAQRAIMSLLPATITDIEKVSNMTCDDIPIDRPQRSNIVFKKGWPNKMQRTKRIRIPFGRRIREVEITYPKLIAICVAGIAGLIALVTAIILLIFAIRGGKKVRRVTRFVTDELKEVLQSEED